MCAIGADELTVLSPGEGVVEDWQPGQILDELGAEGWTVGHTVARHAEINK